MRKLFSFIGIILLLGSPLFMLKADAAKSNSLEYKTYSDVFTNSDTGYQVILEDDADLLSDEEEAQLALEMQEITAYGNAAFKTISENRYSAYYYADDYYHTLFGRDSGTLFLIDMDNREIYIFSDGAIYRIITDSYADTITDNVYRYASRGEYYQCASHAFAQIISLLSGHKIAQPMKYISNILLALILAALINYLLANILSKTSKPDSKAILGAASTGYAFTEPQTVLTRKTKTYSPASSGGGSGGGGGHSGGGGGHSGGGGGHRF